MGVKFKYVGYAVNLNTQTFGGCQLSLKINKEINKIECDRARGTHAQELAAIAR